MLIQLLKICIIDVESEVILMVCLFSKACYIFSLALKVLAEKKIRKEDDSIEIDLFHIFSNLTFHVIAMLNKVMSVNRFAAFAYFPSIVDDVTPKPLNHNS